MAWPVTDYTRPWDSLSAEEKRLFARMAEVYAGFLAHADHHIGRLLDYLEQNGELDNTLVIVVACCSELHFLCLGRGSHGPWRVIAGRGRRAI